MSISAKLRKKLQQLFDTLEMRRRNDLISLSQQSSALTIAQCKGCSDSARISTCSMVDVHVKGRGMDFDPVASKNESGSTIIYLCLMIFR